MNKEKLNHDLQILIDQQPEGQRKIFLQLLRQIWQIDYTVPAYDIWGHMVEYDITYFSHFMAADSGDENEEKQLLLTWIQSRFNGQPRLETDILIQLIDSVNTIRSEASK